MSYNIFLVYSCHIIYWMRLLIRLLDMRFRTSSCFIECVTGILLTKCLQYCREEIHRPYSRYTAQIQSHKTKRSYSLVPMITCPASIRSLDLSPTARLLALGNTQSDTLLLDRIIGSPDLILSVIVCSTALHRTVPSVHATLSFATISIDRSNHHWRRIPTSTNI